MTSVRRRDRSYCPKIRGFRPFGWKYVHHRTELRRFPFRLERHVDHFGRIRGCPWPLRGTRRLRRHHRCCKRTYRNGPPDRRLRIHCFCSLDALSGLEAIRSGASCAAPESSVAEVLFQGERKTPQPRVPVIAVSIYERRHDGGLLVEEIWIEKASSSPLRTGDCSASKR